MCQWAGGHRRLWPPATAAAAYGTAPCADVVCVLDMLGCCCMCCSVAAPKSCRCLLLCCCQHQWCFQHQAWLAVGGAVNCVVPAPAFIPRHPHESGNAGELLVVHLCLGKCGPPCGAALLGLEDCMLGSRGLGLGPEIRRTSVRLM